MKMLYCLLFALFSNAFPSVYKNNHQINLEIVNFIKRDLSQQGKKPIDSSLFLVLERSTDFQLGDFTSDVISDIYIKNFSFSNSEQVKQNKDLIDRIEDSLQEETIRINNLCQDSVTSQLSQRPEPTIFLLFSPRCENMVYVRVIHSQSVSILNGKPDIYGLVYSYLFYVDQGKIQKVYRGLINYN
jgi:hypothetical protein